MTESDLTDSDFGNPEFWRQLIPELSVNESSSISERSTWGTDREIDQGTWSLCEQTLHQDGYFAYPGWYDPRLADRLSEAFLRLNQHQLPTIFAFVYDELWDLLLQLDPLLSALIEDYELPSAIWTWLVSADQQSAFAPHRDQVRDAGLGDDEHLDYLTLWIPLTDLDHTTSNICLVPASADPDYGQGIDRVQVPDLQQIRCLQGVRGSVFGWTTGLIHWGTRQPDYGSPRMSVGACVQSPDAVCFDPPIIDLEQPLGLDQRLALIGQQILNYGKDSSDFWLKAAEHFVAGRR